MGTNLCWARCFLLLLLEAAELVLGFYCLSVCLGTLNVAVDSEDDFRLCHLLVVEGTSAVGGRRPRVPWERFVVSI